MKSVTIISLLIINFFVFSTFAQDQNSGNMMSSAEQSRERTEREMAMKAEGERKQQEFERLRNISNSPVVANPIRTNREVLNPQAAIKEQEKLLRPNIEDSAKYSTFLKTQHTGLIKLSSDFDCFEKNVIRISGLCEKIIPIGSLYSFRKASHASGISNDLRLNNNQFSSIGILSNGIIVSLGDVSIENISLSSDGVKFLTDFLPAKENKEILAVSKYLANGLKNGNYYYSNSVNAAENTTYAIRVIAYRGKIQWRTPNLSRSINILSGDKRVDLIVVFRIVRKDEDGTITLLWKELQRKDSPKIELSKEEQEQYFLRK